MIIVVVVLPSFLYPLCTILHTERWGVAVFVAGWAGGAAVDTGFWYHCAGILEDREAAKEGCCLPTASVCCQGLSITFVLQLCNLDPFSKDGPSNALPLACIIQLMTVGLPDMAWMSNYVYLTCQKVAA